MQTIELKADFREFTLPSGVSDISAAVIPTVKGTWLMKYGKHAYYFYNFKKNKGFCVEISHKNILRPGFDKLKNVLTRTNPELYGMKSLTGRYHYGFNVFEQMALMTVPHAVTELGNGRFIINLWSFFGYLVIDCVKRTVEYRVTDEEDQVLGSQQWFDVKTQELYYMTYTLSDSLKRIKDPHAEVSSAVMKREIASGKTSEVWKGQLSDYMHDILISVDRRYCVVCELGMFTDEKKDILPSKVLIVDMQAHRHWIISRFIVAAHAQFDPDEPHTIYFSNHNFQFKHANILKTLINASYDIDFRGPAAVYKYELTPDGPRECGLFTEPDLFRLTNIHVFRHRSRKILVAVGAPDFLFIADAGTMKLIKKIRISHPRNVQHLFRDVPCRVGTFSPSPDGEKVYVQTNKSFQIVDIDSGKATFSKELYFTHMCANHMLTTHDVDW